MIYFVHVLLDCNLFEIDISYGFRNIKAINLLCQQPSAQLIVTLNIGPTLKNLFPLQASHMKANHCVSAVVKALKF